MATQSYMLQYFAGSIYHYMITEYKLCVHYSATLASSFPIILH